MFSIAFALLSLEVKQNWKIPSVGKIMHDKFLNTVEIKRKMHSKITVKAQICQEAF